jgi:hypothetical protein
MMTLRWTQEAGAEMRSVFLCTTKSAAATMDDLVALQQQQGVNVMTTIFVEKIGVFLENQYYDKFSVSFFLKKYNKLVRDCKGSILKGC